MKPLPDVHPSGFWDALAPHHAAIEDNYLDRRSLRHILPELRAPVLLVGAGQGLILEGLRKSGFQSEGVDLSSEMIRHAKRRRGLDIVHADARALPYATGTFETILFATGVVDFVSDEALIVAMLQEGRRVLRPLGSMWVAFYRMSPPLEDFVARTGLLQNHRLLFRQTLELHRLNLIQSLGWVAQRVQVGRWQAAALMLRMWFRSTRQEKVAALNMQKIFRNAAQGQSLIKAAPETQPYRNEPEIRNLFTRLAIPLQELQTLQSCFIARV